MPVTAESNFQRELVYVHRNGDLLVFTYNEFRNDSVVPTTSLTIRHDLRDGPRLEVKDWVIDIRSATELGIQYRVLPRG
jgi:hypothetical protein